jgi:hypothetical protein
MTFKPPARWARRPGPMGEARLRRLLSVLFWFVCLSLGAGALFDLLSWNVAAFLTSSSALLWRFADERLSRPRRQTSP